MQRNRCAKQLEASARVARGIRERGKAAARIERFKPLVERFLRCFGREPEQGRGALADHIDITRPEASFAPGLADQRRAIVNQRRLAELDGALGSPGRAEPGQGLDRGQ